jgi:hypothetical protein
VSESLLHQQLKRLYARDETATERVVGGFRIDAVDEQDRLVEIQTGSFGAIAPKLRRLLKKHTVVLVHPVVARRWILPVDADGVIGKRRASPIRGRWEDVFAELVALPDLLAHARLCVQVLLTEEEELRLVRPARRRQKPYTVIERRLVRVIERVELDTPGHWLRVLPQGLERWFTTRGLAQRLECSEALARCICYCLRENGRLLAVGKLGNRVIHARAGELARPDGEERLALELRELKRGDWAGWKRLLRRSMGDRAEARITAEERLQALGELLAEDPERLEQLLREEQARRATRPEPV